MCYFVHGLTPFEKGHVIVILRRAQDCLHRDSISNCVYEYVHVTVICQRLVHILMESFKTLVATVLNTLTLLLFGLCHTPFWGTLDLLIMFKVTPMKKGGEDPAMCSGRSFQATIFDSTGCQGVNSG